MPKISKVLIVGAGIAGMALAIGLKRSGIRSELVEIDPHWSALGVGMALQGPALRALGQIGVLDRCMEAGFGYSYFKFCDADGNVTSTVDLPRLNGPKYPATVGIMRQRVHDVLKQELDDAEVTVRLGVTVSSLEQHLNGANVTFDDGSSGSYDLLVGADGSNSKIRDLVFGSECRPAFTGQAVWRATVSRPPEVQSRCSFFGPRNKAGCNPVSSDQMYIFLVQNLAEPVRLADKQLIDVMRSQLADFGGFLASARDEVTDPKQVVYRPVQSHILPAPWYRGPVVLIGDAAHTATPQLASGAGIAIEDAIVLAQELRSETSLPNALEAFMTRRYERARLIVENSFQLGEWEKNPHAPNADPAGLTAKTVGVMAQPI
ncbi:MAG TPA: FAD-dependent oxidoreductase [Candidatus Acidoferrales bacterium]|nr:FAD-dependent oxidoreductase [Candidatus Acidoferrales bacterium]